MMLLNVDNQTVQSSLYFATEEDANGRHRVALKPGGHGKS